MVNNYAARQSLHAAHQFVRVDNVQPALAATTTGGLERALNVRIVRALFTNSDLVSDFDLERRDINLATINLNVAVAYELTSLAARHRKSKPVDHVIKPTFKQRQQILTCHALLAGGFLKVVTELCFEQIVNALNALLFT